jgi:hypothetical protein
MPTTRPLDTPTTHPSLLSLTPLTSPTLLSPSSNLTPPLLRDPIPLLLLLLLLLPLPLLRIAAAHLQHRRSTANTKPPVRSTTFRPPPCHRLRTAMTRSSTRKLLLLPLLLPPLPCSLTVAEGTRPLFKRLLNRDS